MIRFCRIDERDKLMRFINDHWRRGHILSQNVELTDYEPYVIFKGDGDQDRPSML